MHKFSQALQKSRKRPIIVWLDDDTLLIDHKRISLHKFREHLHFHINTLRTFLAEKVLLGINLEEIGVNIDFEKLGDEGDFTTVDYSPLLGGLDGNPDSNKLLKALVDQGKLVSFRDGEIAWNFQRAQEWEADIHEAVCKAYSLSHICEGAPGRVTEEDKMLVSNTFSSHRHTVTAPGLNTLATCSNYWKGAQVSGRFKEILRVFPRAISDFIFILVRLIRPLELLFLIQHVVHEKARQDTIKAYSASLWTSFGQALTASAMYRSFANLMALPGNDGKRTFDFAFNIRLYHQFTAAVQRRHLPGPSRYTQKIANSLTSIGDLQAGRSEGTSHQHYAPEKSTVNMEPGFIAHYVAYSCDWHKFLGLETESTGMLKDTEKR